MTLTVERQVTRTWSLAGDGVVENHTLRIYDKLNITSP